jgi:hypothetical protein
MRISGLAFATVMSIAIVTPSFAASTKPISQNEAGRQVFMQVLLPLALPSPLFLLYMMKKNQDAKKK